MFGVVWLTGLDRLLATGFRTREIIGMDGIGGAPLFELFERPAKVLEDPAVDVLELAGGRHDRDESGNGFDDQPKAVLAWSGTLTFNVAPGWMGRLGHANSPSRI